MKLFQNVRREPKSTGQQTVTEGKTGADKMIKYSGLLLSERRKLYKLTHAGEKSFMHLVF